MLNRQIEWYKLVRDWGIMTLLIIYMVDAAKLSNRQYIYIYIVRGFTNPALIKLNTATQVF